MFLQKKKKAYFAVKDLGLFSQGFGGSEFVIKVFVLCSGKMKWRLRFCFFCKICI